jgi:hypothetical protein
MEWVASSSGVVEWEDNKISIARDAGILSRQAMLCFGWATGMNRGDVEGEKEERQA